MIELTRVQARQLRAVLRKAVPLGCGRGPRPPLVLSAGKDGLRARSSHPEVAVEFHLPGARPADRVVLPAEALDDFEGSKDAPVCLENVGPKRVQARWSDGGVPQARDYPAPDPDGLPPFPEAPPKLFPIDAGLLKALEDAARTAAREGVRFALHRLQLRGATGDVVASDGKQMLLQGGFALPWKEELLVAAVGAFGCRELPADGPVAVGRTEQYVCLRVGPWTFWLGIDAAGRFPKAETVIPAAGGGTVCRLSPEDAEFLARALPRLPGGGEDCAPVTLDLDVGVAVRSRGQGQERATELVLARSEVVGPAVRLVSDRRYLARALALGFAEFRVARPDAPVVCAHEYRTYLWMTLDAAGAIPPDSDAVRIRSTGETPVPPKIKKERSKESMSKPTVNGHANGQANGQPPPRDADNGHAAGGAGLGTLIAEAQGLREALRAAHGRAARLVAALRKQKQQSRLMASALAGLRQLQRLQQTAD